jgi:mannose-1-phosphate guanylyltransferase
MFKAAMLIDGLTTYSPEIVTSVNDAVNNTEQDLDFIRLDRQAFESSPSDSIDYVLMEKSNNVVVVPLDAQWNDIGTKDSNGSVIQGDVFTEETTNIYINAALELCVKITSNAIVDNFNFIIIHPSNMRTASNYTLNLIL